MTGEMGRVRVVLGGFTGGPGMMTLYYRGAPAINWSFIAEDIIGGVAGAFEYNAGLWPGSFTYSVQGAIDLLDPANGEILETLAESNVSGTGSGTEAYAPIATGFCVNWLTPAMRNGRHLRGRTFLVPIEGSLVQADGSPSTPGLVLANSWATAITAVVPSGASQVVWGRPTFTEPGHTVARTGVDAAVSSHVIADKFAVLRSRRD